MVGIGPGDREHMTLKAVEVLKKSEVVVGYKLYLDLIGEMIKDKICIRGNMTEEKERCWEAIRWAKQGYNVAVVSSGDPGIYGMAGLIFELLGETEDLEIEIVCGVSAAQAAASLLGAPLMNDYVSISLSDRLTPWEEIEKKIVFAAMADLVIVFYNPKSRGRNWQIGRARELLLRHRKADTPVGIARNALRGSDFAVTISTLEDFTNEEIDMNTTVIVGNSQTKIIGNRMVNARGYRL